MTTALLIKSFRKHFASVRLLLESIDQFNSDGLPVYLIVPERDRKSLRRPMVENLEIVVEEDLVLNKYSDRETYKDNFLFHQIRKWRGVDSIGGRSCYRGALVQQLCKLALPLYLRGKLDNFIILDSDVAFVRPFRESDFVKDHVPELIALPTQWKSKDTLGQWMVDAKDFLGLKPFPEPYNWIALGTCWRYDVILSFVKYVENQHQRHWQEALMEYSFVSKFQDHVFFSEMQLYGIFHKYLSPFKQLEINRPKVFNLWTKYDLYEFVRKTDETLRNQMASFVLFGLQKEFATPKVRRLTVEKIQKILNSCSFAQN
jgi:hypothetical protein